MRKEHIAGSGSCKQKEIYIYGKIYNDNLGNQFYMSNDRKIKFNLPFTQRTWEYLAKLSKQLDRFVYVYNTGKTKYFP